MKLYSRGDGYEDNPPMLEVTEREIVGKNRGQHDTFSYVRHIPVPSPMPSLREHGLSCHIRQTHLAKPISAVQPAASESGRKWQLDKNIKITTHEPDKTQQANICQSLEQPLWAAKAKGDNNLIRC